MDLMEESEEKGGWKKMRNAEGIVTLYERLKEECIEISTLDEDSILIRNTFCPTEKRRAKFS